MNSVEKKFLAPFKGKVLSSPPVWMMRQAGRYLPEYRKLRADYPDFLSFCYTPSACLEAILQPLRRFDFDAAILFSDILVIPDALGQKVTFHKGVGPVLEPLDMNPDSLESLKHKNVTAYLKPVYTAVQKISAAIEPSKALIGFSGAPWTLASYMIETKGSRDHANVKSFALKNPKDFALLIDVLVAAVTEHLQAQIRQGAHAVKIFDSWAGVLCESQFMQWVVEPTQRIVHAIKQHHPDIPIIGFAKSCGVLVEKYAAQTGLDGVNIDSQTPLPWAIDTLEPSVVLCGNLDNYLLAYGHQDEIKRAVNNILKQAQQRPFIFNLGHGILPATPPENVDLVVKLIRQSS